MTAVSRIIQRSERQESAQKLVDTYVEVGLKPQLNNLNHQIFYGRRGTGKTHVMKVLEAELTTIPKNTVVYIDCRTLGSTTQFSNSDASINVRCLALFRDFLNSIYHGLLEHIVENPSMRANEALQEADRLVSLINQPVSFLQPSSMTTGAEYTFKRDLSVKAELSLPMPKGSINTGGGMGDIDIKKKETNYSIDTEHKIVFPELNKSLSKVLDLADTRL